MHCGRPLIIDRESSEVCPGMTEGAKLPIPLSLASFSDVSDNFLYFSQFKGSGGLGFNTFGCFRNSEKRFLTKVVWY